MAAATTITALDYVLAGAVSAGLLFYLTYALLRPSTEESLHDHFEETRLPRGYSLFNSLACAGGTNHTDRAIQVNASDVERKPPRNVMP
ncbi:MAG: potassium-transporting ATPase subunit F [Bradyrhizobiaceae bacterium]|nr:MAG: potassium-transporting ATPase subunit F [Bradyrhizobiaceae bacterium]